MSQAAPDVVGLVPRVWTIDSARSSLSFAVRHLNLHTVRGTVSGITGTVTVGEDAASSSVTATLNLTTVDTGWKMQSNAIRSRKLLDVDSNPTATYRSTAVVRSQDGSYVVDGELTFMGVTAAVPLRLTVDVVDGRPMFRASGELVRSDFGFSLHEGPKFMDRAIAARIPIELQIEVG